MVLGFFNFDSFDGPAAPLAWLVEAFDEPEGTALAEVGCFDGPGTARSASVFAILHGGSTPEN